MWIHGYYAMCICTSLSTCTSLVDCCAILVLDRVLVGHLDFLRQHGEDSVPHVLLHRCVRGVVVSRKTVAVVIIALLCDWMPEHLSHGLGASLDFLISTSGNPAQRKRPCAAPFSGTPRRPRRPYCLCTCAVLWRKTHALIPGTTYAVYIHAHVRATVLGFLCDINNPPSRCPWCYCRRRRRRQRHNSPNP